ncbi:MAG: macro domain-containing protein [Actinomycetota bacterium]|nr:macro domain-containing protein [Actinomycetota bacterium]
MNWHFKSGEILDEPADVLVCSANVFLNLSGGVGGAILLRCGRGMQDELHAYLNASGSRFVQPGEVVRTAPWGLPVRAVMHAVAVDGFYGTSIGVVRTTVVRCLDMAAALDACRVALTALATGYGRLRMRDFGAAVAPLRGRAFGTIDDIVFCVRTEADRDELASAASPT